MLARMRFSPSAAVLALLLIATTHVPLFAAEKEKVVPYSQILGPIRLWEGDAPGALGQRPQDIPTLTPYPADPAKQTGASMLVLPGGGYGNLAEHEGKGYA